MIATRAILVAVSLVMPLLAGRAAARDADRGWLSAGFGGATVVALDRAESGHAAWTTLEAGQGWWRVGAAVGVVYPGGRVQTRATFFGLTGRAVVARLSEGLTLEASALAGLVEPDAARARLERGEGLPADAARWASGRALIVSPALGARWTPATPGLFLDLEARVVNVSHLGLFFGAGLAF
jgi:hypothetical protein